MTNSFKIGIIDADLLDNGTRHPNLALMKIAGYLKKKGIQYTLIKSTTDNISFYDYIYLSKVFTFTKEPLNILNYPESKILKGGTGYYANETDSKLFSLKRNEDLSSLGQNWLLKNLNYKEQMPDYNLYNEYIDIKIKEGKSDKTFKDYKKYSIGFLTRGCIRQCVFCVNKDLTFVERFSNLKDFIDPLKPYIYLWDDNFLASKDWKELLQKLIDSKKYFQFRQGLDIRLMTEEKAIMLSKSKYHGDFIFAFDNINDKSLIERKIILWKQHCKKTTKFYLFCGYLVRDNEEQYDDIRDLFIRIRILMTHGCLPYIMRHENFRNSKHWNLYIQIARWCNQPQFYKKMSFYEFCLRNQFYKKTESLGASMLAYNAFISEYSTKYPEIIVYFTMKYESF